MLVLAAGEAFGDANMACMTNSRRSELFFSVSARAAGLKVASRASTAGWFRYCRISVRSAVISDADPALLLGVPVTGAMVVCNCSTVERRVVRLVRER